MVNYKFFSKTIFFPEKGILAVGDLHLGYEQMLLEQGMVLPFNQLETTQEELEKIIQQIGKDKIKKIVLLGDIKHNFSFEKGEMYHVRHLLRFLESYVPAENIILIRGNHDQVRLYNREYYDVYVEDGIAFTHGHKDFPEIHDKKIKLIVMSHIHPAVVIKDNSNIKREKFKCFLVGKWNKKQTIIVPSFFPMIEGSEINESQFGIIPSKELQKFKTFIVGENRVYEFGVYGGI